MGIRLVLSNRSSWFGNGSYIIFGLFYLQLPPFPMCGIDLSHHISRPNMFSCDQNHSH